MKVSGQLDTAVAFDSRVKNMAPDVNTYKLSRYHL